MRVMLLPGVVLPADLAYGRLVSVLGSDVETIVKELEVYREESSPRDYSLDREVAGALRERMPAGGAGFVWWDIPREALPRWPSRPVCRHGCSAWPC